MIGKYLASLHCKFDVNIKVGAERIARCATPNCDPTFIECLADIVATHLKAGETVRPQMLMTCPMCTEQTCKSAKMWWAKATGYLEQEQQKLKAIKA